jgi:hypothetical protein
MMIARCKFQVTNILPAYAGTDPDSTAKRVRFETRYDNTIDEDRAFTRYTPSGALDVVIDNPSVTDKLSIGLNVYIDISAA